MKYNEVGVDGGRVPAGTGIPFLSGRRGSSGVEQQILFPVAIAAGHPPGKKGAPCPLG